MILFSEINKGKEIVQNVINKEKFHPNYKRTVDLANDYVTAITGEGFERWLHQYSKRETKDDFDTRKLLTSKVFVPAISKFIEFI